MSRARSRHRAEDRRFIIFVKPINEDGLVDERNCGWICKDMNICKNPRSAVQFIEKESGRGSYRDWLELIGEDHPDWAFADSPTYVDEVKSLSNP